MIAHWRCCARNAIRFVGGFALSVSICFGGDKVVREPVLREPVLGEPELIGSLLIVAASGEDTDESAAPAPIPMLDADAKLLQAVQPGQSNSVTPTSLGDLKPIPPPSDPAQIAFHLGQAITGMMAVGLADDAKEIGTILTRFQTQHHTRLLLIQKQTEVAELQAEIERLKARIEKGITADQVSMSFRILEITDLQAAKRLGLIEDQKVEEGVAPLQMAVKLMQSAEFENGLKRLRDMNGVKVLAAPRIITQSGETANFSNGRTVSYDVLNKVAGTDESIFHGQEFSAKPVVLDNKTVRLSFKVSSSKVDDTAGVTIQGQFVPGMSRWVVNTTQDLNVDNLLVMQVPDMKRTDAPQSVMCLVTKLGILEPRSIQQAVPVQIPSQLKRDTLRTASQPEPTPVAK